MMSKTTMNIAQFEFSSIEGNVVHHQGEPYLSTKYLAGVLGWADRTKRKKQTDLFEEDPDLIILWDLEHGMIRAVSDPEVPALLKGRRVAFYVPNEGVQQLMQWEKKYPHAKAFRKFVRKSMKELMTTGTVTVAQPEAPIPAIQERQLQLQEAESRRQDVELIMRLFGDDARMTQHASDFV